MKILHSGDGHYHLGGSHDHAHGDHDHDHDHGHAHNHEHTHSHSHKAVDNKELREGLINADGEDHHDHEHKHDHGAEGHHDHDHAEHDHDHAHDKPKSIKQSKNINVESAYLHVLGDMIMSIGVIIAGTIIYFAPQLW